MCSIIPQRSTTTTKKKTYDATSYRTPMVHLRVYLRDSKGNSNRRQTERKMNDTLHSPGDKRVLSQTHWSANHQEWKRNRTQYLYLAIRFPQDSGSRRSSVCHNTIIQDILIASFSFIHLADTFTQSNLHCIQILHYGDQSRIYSVHLVTNIAKSSGTFALHAHKL